MIHPLIIQDTECKAEVRLHDTSVTGLRYKMIVTVPKRLLPNRRRYPYTTQFKSKHDLGAWALDAGNTLYHALGFKYGWNPSIDRGDKNTTTITFFFNDLVEAERLGFTEDSKLREVYLRHEEKMSAEGYPAFVAPYRRKEG